MKLSLSIFSLAEAQLFVVKSIVDCVPYQVHYGNGQHYTKAIFPIQVAINGNTRHPTDKHDEGDYVLPDLINFWLNRHRQPPLQKVVLHIDIIDCTARKSQVLHQKTRRFLGVSFLMYPLATATAAEQQYNRYDATEIAIIIATTIAFGRVVIGYCASVAIATATEQKQNNDKTTATVVVIVTASTKAIHSDLLFSRFSSLQYEQNAEGVNIL